MNINVLRKIAFVESTNEEGFIDNTRNVGVVLGEKDIKQDVKTIKSRLMQFSGIPRQTLSRNLTADFQLMSSTLRMTTRL